MYQIYPKTVARLPVRYKNNYGRFQFWVSIFENVVQKGILHVKALVEKQKIPEMIGKAGTEETCIIADGAAIEQK